MIRPYRPTDLPTLLDVWDAATRLAHPFLEEDYLAQERVNIPEKYIPVADTWVCEREGAVVGFLALIGNEVGALFVDPAHHGAGFGRALMDKARELHATLELDVFEANSIGRRFYERYGFTVLEKTVHGPTGHPLLRLGLGSAPS